jgi:cell division protein FtsA
LSKTILAVDIGSTKISVVIAELFPTGNLEVTGHGYTKSKGVKKGIITNIELTSRSIKKALTDARRIAGNNVSVATVSISNAYVKSLNSKGIVNIPHKDISIKEINRVMEAALYNAKIPSEYEVIHVLPYNFKVDEQNFIEDPYGMNASRMEVDVNIILTQKSSLSNLTKAVYSAGLEIESIVLNSYASAIATMNKDEKALGAVVIDLGGQSSNLVVYMGNAIRYSSYIPVGSKHITNDLSMMLHTPLDVAEDLKIKHGNLIASGQEDSIELPVLGNNEVFKRVQFDIIHSVISSRVRELLFLLKKSIAKSNLQDEVLSGFILTGGMAKLDGLREVAEEIFGKSVRIARPRKLNGLFKELNDPASATVVGLLLHRIGEHTPYEVDNTRRLLHNKQDEANSEDNLGNIRLGKSESRSIQQPGDRFSEKQSKGSNEKVHKQKDEPFSFEDLTQSDDSGRTAWNRMIDWAKQLF